MANLNQLRYYQSSMNSNDDSMHEYVDCELINNSNSLIPQPIIYSQLKTANIIDNCADYYLSIIKWSSNSNLPVLVPSMKLSPTPQLYNGQTNYFISIGVGTNLSNTVFGTANNVLYTSQHPWTTNPQYNPINQADIYNNPYYYVYSVQSFLDDVNVTLEGVFSAAKLLHPTVFINAIAPRFIWDSTINKICLLITDEFVADTNIVSTTSKGFIQFNSELFTLFNTFDYEQISVDGYVFSLSSKYGLDSYQTSNPNDTAKSIIVNKYYQASSSVPLWSPVDSIVFSTTQIPVEFSQTGVPVYLGQNVISNSNAIQNNNCILTDFTVPMDTGLEYNFSTIVYYPQSEYRLVDLLGNAPLTFLNLIVSWRDKVGLTHQLLLKNGQSAKIKILLRKRNFGSIIL